MTRLLKWLCLFFIVKAAWDTVLARWDAMYRRAEAHVLSRLLRWLCRVR